MIQNQLGDNPKNSPKKETVESAKILSEKLINRIGGNE